MKRDGRTVPYEYDAGPQHRVAGCEAHEDAVGAYLFESGTVHYRLV